MVMSFEWNEHKNQSNIQKHGLSFEEAAAIFDSVTFTYESTGADYGEKRYVSIGAIEDVVIVVVVYTPRNGLRRIISARLAGREERRAYEAHIKAAT